MIEFVVSLALFLLMLAIVGAIADSNDRRDAKRRSAAPRYWRIR